MIRPRQIWLALGWAGLHVVGFGAPSASAADSPAQVLSAKGLTASGWVYLVESESTFHGKLAEAKAGFADWSNSRAKLDEQQDNQATVDELTEQANYLKADIAMARQMAQGMAQGQNQQLGGYGQTGFNLRGGFGQSGAFGPSGFQQMQNAQDAQMLAGQLNQAQATLTELTAEINRARNLILSKEDKQKLIEENSKQRASLKTLVAELRKSADETTEQYSGLKGDPAVEQALASLAKESKSRPKLGPSKEFLADVKILDKIERSLASGGSRVARKSGRRAKTKAATKSVPPSKRVVAKKSATQ